MRIVYHTIAALTLAVCAVQGICATGRTAIDPNAVKKPAIAFPPDAPDPRLNEKITYDGGYKRLHLVIDDLAGMTSLTLRCGKNNTDWQVRDIPIVLNVKDMPLGKVLRTIADAAHLQFITEKTQTDTGKQIIIYRLYRTRKGEEEITKGLAARKKTTRALAEWAWDALVSVSNAPDELFASLPKTSASNGLPADPRTLSMLMAAIGPSYKEKILSGEPFAMRAGDVIPTALHKDIMTRTIESLTNMSESGYLPTTPTQEEIDHAVLAARLSKLDSSEIDESLVLTIGGIPVEMKSSRPEGMIVPDDWPETQRVPRSWWQEPIKIARQLASAKGSKIPPPPDADALLKALDRTPNPDLKPIITDDDWNLPLLRSKVKLDLPKDKLDFSQADVLTALAKAAGISIACEDFASHTRDKRVPAQSLTLELTLGDVLKKINKTAMGRDRMSGDQLTWFVDQDQKMLVGWAGDWRTHHANLAPADIIENLASKRAGSGADLDDMAPLFRLTRGQFHEWVYSSPDLWDIQLTSNMLYAEQAIWRIYDALSPGNKALAKSEAGFPLVALDPAWTSNLIRETQSDYYDGVIKDTVDEDLPADLRHRQELVTSPAFLSNCVMRVKGNLGFVTFCPPELPNLSGTAHPPVAGDINKRCFYSIELTGSNNGKLEQITSESLTPFLSFTLKREAELIKQAETTAAVTPKP